MTMEAPMVIEVDPRVDIVFKKLFGSTDHPTESGEAGILEAVEITTSFERSQRMRHAYDMKRNYERIIASYKRTSMSPDDAASVTGLDREALGTQG